MSVAIVTGSGGLIGSAAARHLAILGHNIVGIDNDMRASYFGPDASTEPNSARLQRDLGPALHRVRVDIRDRDKIARLFERHGSDVELVVHTAAQPSHDYAAGHAHTDFDVNAGGTLTLLEAARRNCPDASFIFCSTNKVYGDRPNDLPLVETDLRLELPREHRYHQGIDTTMSVDQTTHSLFGVSKLAADLAVQEYGRYFEMPTVCFRGGCLTGPAHAGTELHGFLAYLMRCTATGERYTVYGHQGKQVRDNIHADDVAAAFVAYHRNPSPGAVYNLGGGPDNNISMLEAIAACETITGETLDWTYSDEARVGDHRWWVSDLGPFQADHPEWQIEHPIDELLREIHEHNRERWDSNRQLGPLVGSGAIA